MVDYDSGQSVLSIGQNGTPSFSPAPQDNSNHLRKPISFIPASISNSTALGIDLSKSGSPTPPVKSVQQRESKNQEFKNGFLASSQRNSGRLPATIDSSLTQQCQITRVAFSKALTNDQHAAAQPDYSTSFVSANDVVRRLLPYHVWHVRDEDLMYVLDGHSTKKRSNEEEDAGQKNSIGSSSTDRITDEGEKKQKERKRSRKGKKRSEISIDRYANEYPNHTETDSLWQRYMDIHSRAKGLLSSMIGAKSVQGAAPFAQESRYNLEKLAWEDEKELISKVHEAARLSREEAINKGVPWSAIMRILNDESDEDSDEESSSEEDGEKASNNGNEGGSNIPGVSAMTPKSFNESLDIPFSPTNQFASRGTPKTRGRPRKERDEHGRIVRPPTTTTTTKETSTPPVLLNQNEIDKQQVVPQKSPTPLSSETTSNGPSKNLPILPEGQTKDQGSSVVNQSATMNPSDPSMRQPTQTQKSSSGPSSSPYVIPSEPIRLILPFSTLTQLNALGISPIPAPHLLPVISARQAAIASGQPSSFSFDQFDTAPRQALKQQQEAALLMGITMTSKSGEIAPSQQNKSGPVDVATKPTLPQDQNRTEMIHVSLVLSKLGPAQLSGLATLMQNMQQAAAASSASTHTPPKQ